MSIAAIRQFCSDFHLPDVSSLVEDSSVLSERYAVVWSVMQHMLDASDQVVFLRTLCDCCISSSDSSIVQKVTKFSRLINPTMDSDQLNSFFELIMMDDGVVQMFNQAVVAFGRSRSLGGILTFTEKHGLESVISGIKDTFPVNGERMQDALDNLAFESNPEGFMQKLARAMQDHDDYFDAKMASLERDIQNLKLQKADLERQLAGSPQTPPESPRGKRALEQKGDCPRDTVSRRL